VPGAVLAVALGSGIPALAGSHSKVAVPHGLTLQTLVNHVNVRVSPNRYARIVGHINLSGTSVVVNCFAIGSIVAGNPVWYHVVWPTQGYITSYYAATHDDPAAGIPRCIVARPFVRPYHTLYKGLHIRTGPSMSASVWSVLGAVGSRVAVNCYVLGQSIEGDRVWYHTIAPKYGYVAGLNLDTGHDPAYGVPRCP
jgi:hypothetical protein